MEHLTTSIAAHGAGSLFDTYAAQLRNLADVPAADGPLPRQLQLGEHGRLSAYYAPFDHINASARVVLVGITPGRAQATTAIAAARRALTDGMSNAAASMAAKNTASFSGPMRSNLVAMLDHVGLAGTLGLSSCADLFTRRTDLVHFTSALRYPVFLDGKDYSGTPSILANAWLSDMAWRWLAAEAEALREAWWVPLGKEPRSVLLAFADKGLLQRRQILDGLPHPSGANAERIAYFLGNKPRGLLSAKTDADALDRARDALVARLGRQPVAAMPASEIAAAGISAPAVSATPVMPAAPVRSSTSAQAVAAPQPDPAISARRGAARTPAGSATAAQAEAIVAARLERYRDASDKLAGFQTRNGRHLAIDRKVQGIQAWTEVLPPPAGLVPKERYAADRPRHSNLRSQAPRLWTGHEVLLWKLQSTDELETLLDWYAEV